MMGDGAYLSMADELQAFSTLANNGAKLPQTLIISAKLNGKAKVLGVEASRQQAIKQDTAYIINDIMSDPNASYLPGSCDATSCKNLADGGYKFQRYQGWKFAVDDGITNNGFDAIMGSWSSKYAVISWVGNHSRDQNVLQYGVTNEQLTIPLTRGLMEAAHNGKTSSNWPKPADIKTLPAYVLTTHIHYGDIEPSPTTDLYPSWYKQ